MGEKWAPNLGTKIIISGNVVEVYQYLKPVTGTGVVMNKTGRRGKENKEENEKKEDIEINREKVLNRARKNLRRTVNCNVQEGSKFMTLTFAENVQDIAWANNEFKKFIKRLDYHLGFKSQYSTVIEFQERGAIHYHTILYNVPKKLKIDKIQEIWGHGFIKINKIKNVDNVGAYICKYMTKCEDEKKLRGHRMYFNSRGLLKPEEIKSPELVMKTLECLQSSEPKYSNVFENDFNLIYYNQYIIKN